MVESVSGNALQGLQRAQNNMQRAASNIARAGNSGPNEESKDLTRSLVELNQHKNAAQASIKTFKVADEILGSLLDVIA